MHKIAQRLAILYIAAHFLWFAFDGTRSGWASDDPMNLYIYWKAGFGRVLWSNLAFANGFYRPLGGLFYLTLYALAKLDPAPYRWVILILLAFNAGLLYRLARTLGGTERMALLAALLGSLHGSMAGLLYQTSDVYDILCRTFALLALICYCEGRKAAALILMVVAINAKEIAATLPALFLLYELLYLRGPLSIRRLAPVALALALAALAMYGKMHGAEAMTANEMYRPAVTFGRWFDANAAYTNVLLYLDLPAAAIWAVVLLICVLLNRRELWFGLGFIFLVTIPISFIPKRLGSSLYLPLAGWAIWIASLVDWGADRIRPRTLRWAALACLAIAFTFLTSYELDTKGEQLKAEQITLTMRPLQQLTALRITPPSGSRVLFVGSPFHDSFDMVFLANLVWNDKSITIDDANLARDRDPAHYDIVLAFDPQTAQLSQVKRSMHE